MSPRPFIYEGTSSRDQVEQKSKQMEETHIYTEQMWIQGEVDEPGEGEGIEWHKIPKPRFRDKKYNLDVKHRVTRCFSCERKC